MWGDETFTGTIQERYDDAPGGIRAVQYFDKSRMEINHDPNVPADSPWHVTNGLLVVEMMTGQMQVGDTARETREPARVNVAGDQGGQHGVTYWFMGLLRDKPVLEVGSTINWILTPGAAGNLYLYSDDLASYGITAAWYVPETNHTIAAPFWEFMNGWGTVYEDGQYVHDQLFENPYYATGLPVTEAYWARVPLAGVQTNVLVQCFERRCLTYTPTNPDGWKVEAGNVGQHYYQWRYGGGIPSEVLYRSDFRDWIEWGIEDDVNGNYGVAFHDNGSYYLVTHPPGSWMYADHRVDFDMANTSVTVTFRLASASAPSAGCVIVGYFPRWDSFCLSWDGYMFGMTEYWAGGDYYTSWDIIAEVPAAASPVITDWNTLTVTNRPSGEGMYYEVLVNGVRAGSGTSRYPIQYQGVGVNIMVADGGTAQYEFSSIEITRLP